MPYSLSNKNRAFLLNTTFRTDFELKKREILFEVETDTIEILFTATNNPG